MNTEPTNDGGPAFPVSSTDPLSGVTEPIPGMSLRDYFAARALVAIVASNNRPTLDGAFELLMKAGGSAGLAKATAEASYIYADAMLAARTLNLAPGRDSK